MKKIPKTGVIILAAGESSRLGQPKQLVKFKGKPLLQHSIDLGMSLDFTTKILVLGAKSKEIKKRINCRDFKAVVNENWQEGVGSSIGKGVSAAIKSENKLDHILILLSDQPFVTKEKIQELIKAHSASKNQATFSEYSGTVGVPAIFSNHLFPALERLKGDQGAKKLISSLNLKFGTVAFINGNFDVDTAADVQLLKQLENN